MLKKYLISLTLLSFLLQIGVVRSEKITPQQTAESFSAISKDQKFILLNKIAEQVNRLAPLDEYTVTVPPFFIITDKDIYQLLATIPYQAQTAPQAPKQKKRARVSRTTSMLDLLEQTWKSVRSSLKKGKATAKTYQLLSDMRDIIETAFNTEHITIDNKEFAHFIQKATADNVPLITRMATDHPTLGPKSFYPVQATSIYKALGDTLKTYYHDITIDQLLQRGSLPANLYATVIVQQFITEPDTAHPLVSGFSCSQDRASAARDISVIEVVYGHHAGFKHDQVMQDTYYVHKDTVIPVIRKKAYRLEPNMEGLHTSLIKNNDTFAQAATLDAHAAQEIAKATSLLAHYSKKPTCVSFIKQHNTIYLIDFHHLSEISTAHATYIDPLYIKKAIKDGAIHAVSLKSLHHVIALKKPQQVLFASDVSDLLEQYEKAADPSEIIAGIIKRKPSQWSKEQKIIDDLPFVTLWSSSPENIQQWITQRAWPLVFDPQTQLIFPYKRRKNFCTLFQIIISGLNGYPLSEHISMIDSFFTPLSTAQKELLRPDEFFSGVSMKYLFDLLKHEQPETALQALRTIIYRLQTRIKRASLISPQQSSEELAQQEQAPIQALEKQYEQILNIGYKLYTMMHHKIKAGKLQSTDDQELLFLIDVFEKMITQTSSDLTVNAVSFNTILEEII